MQRSVSREQSVPVLRRSTPKAIGCRTGDPSTTVFAAARARTTSSKYLGGSCIVVRRSGSWAGGSGSNAGGCPEQFPVDKGKVGVDHHANELRQLHLGFPPQLLPSLAGVANQQIDLR